MEIEGFLKKILEAHENKLPFTVFRYPESKKVFAYVQDDASLFLTQDFEGSGFVMAPFDSSEDAVIFPKEKSDQFNCSFDDQDLFFDESSSSFDTSVQSRDKKYYLELVRKAIARIHAGECQKIVVSRSVDIEIKKLDIADLLKKMMFKYPSAFVYIWYHPEIGMWAGATPETLLNTDGRNFKTMSLAGTQKYEGNINVEWGVKEIEEQKIVTRHIEDELSDFSISSGKTYTVKAGNLVHLCNDIVGTFEEKIQLKELIDRLHPTSAVCGLPRSKAMGFIRSEENHKRRFYTGFLGEINQRKIVSHEQKGIDGVFSRLFVNLRCMKLAQGESIKATLFMGGGITGQSDPYSEWSETLQKSLVMKSVL